jgi:hypothetical protein
MVELETKAVKTQLDYTSYLSLGIEAVGDEEV